MSNAARLLAVILIAGGALLTLPLGATSAATVNVPVAGTIGQYWYCNSSYQNGNCPTMINVGDTVNWQFNGDIYSIHTATHCGANCNSPTGSPLFDSGQIQVGNYSYQFNTPGTYLYQCEIHTSSMRGTITVSGGVGGETQLADIGAGLAEQGGNPWLAVWVGAAAISGGMLVLACAAWAARRTLAADETPR
jgi:plastocyanin